MKLPTNPKSGKECCLHLRVNGTWQNVVREIAQETGVKPATVVDVVAALCRRGTAAGAAGAVLSAIKPRGEEAGR